ncbi:hypothetical protein [uncultured Gimesia sp.]|uniref:hypothetical protein n=1 Tax=uncultured Gimesia sp. TaxID=1678688 RepID=UPI0026162E3A|nr:hypothetical protein [uncultured Gimesia sp.]
MFDRQVLHSNHVPRSEASVVKPRFLIITLMAIWNEIEQEVHQLILRIFEIHEKAIIILNCSTVLVMMFFYTSMTLSKSGSMENECS